MINTKKKPKNTLLQTLTKEYYTSGLRPRSMAARKWFTTFIENKPTTPYSLMNSRNLSFDAFIGGMFFFVYSAKHKKTLPYWDRFPLVIPLDIGKDHMLGLNLHYVDYQTRAILLDRILNIQGDATLTPSTRLGVTYSMLSSYRKLKALKPCIHMYLFDHIQSQFLPVQPEEWDIAIFLPVERFVGIAKEDVWTKSRSI